MNEDHILEDWGGYKPETQKALRFVALHDKGAAKQIAGAIVKEYAKPEQTKPTQTQKRPAKKALTYYDLKVLSTMKAMPNAEYEAAVRYSGFSAELFSESIDTLVEQGYLVGNAFTGYVRTKKRLPQVTFTEDEIEMIVDKWITDHPHRYIDEKQRRFMIQTHLMMQKAMPGWTL